MKPVLLFFENHSKKIEILFGIIGVLSSVSGFVWKWLNVFVFISLFALIAFISFRFYLRNRKENFSKGKLIFLNIIAYTILASIPFSLYHSFVKPSKKCNQSTTEIGVLITKFSNEISDDFSYSLTNSISELLTSHSNISIAFVDTFLNQEFNINPEKSGDLITENCFKKGIVVFGKRSEDSKLFDCTIFVSKNLKSEYVEKELEKNRIIRLKNPDLIEFSIDNQSTVVAELVIAILDFYNQNYSAAAEKLNKLESSGLLNEHKELLSLCKIYKANAYLGNSDLSSSSESYKEIILAHPELPIVNYNYAMLNLAQGDSLTAQTYFEIAQKLDSNLNNPLEGIAIKTESVTNEGSVPEINLTDKSTMSGNASVSNKNLESQSKPISSQAQPTSESKPSPQNKDNQNQKNKFYFENCFYSKICVFDARGKRTGIYDYLYQVEKLVNGESFYYVMKEGSWGIIDNYGRLIIPPNHESPNEALKSLAPFLD